MNVFVRYAVELAIIIPDAVFIFLPVRDSLRRKPRETFIVSGVLLLCYVLAASWVCSANLLPVIPALIVSVTFLFLVFSFSVKVSLGRKLFCFFNAVMLGAFCLLYSIVLMASEEAENTLWESARLLSLDAGIMSLSLSVLAVCVFFKMLTEELPVLLKEEYMDGIWNFMFLLPLGAALLIAWMTPVWPKYFLVGRVQMFTLILLPLIPLVLLLFYYLLWRTAAKFSEGARHRQENTLLTMEGKHYRELRAYMDETRAMRHDFRQHILVITGLAGAGKWTELQSYLQQFADASEAGYTGYCGNIAVDAVASHYTAYAELQGADIEWHINLPAELPMNESEYCAVLGNLVENALKAVKNLPEGQRRVKVISSLLSDAIIGLSVENPFCGSVVLGRNGLPRSDSEGHGIGLMSVQNTVKRHQGSMNITAENNIFSVDIVLYCR